MSATTLAHKGVEAVQRKDYAVAVQLLDKALESSSSPAWLLSRAVAHQHLKDYDAALHDAELAYHVAAARGSGNSRKQMIEAQYRRAVVYYQLGRYADADCCAKWSMLLAEGRPAGEKDGVEANVDQDGNYVISYEDGVADNKGQPGQADKSNSLDSIMDLANQGASGSANPKTGFEQDWKRAYTWRSQALGAMKKLPKDHPGRKVSVTKVPPKPQKKTEKKPEPEPEPADKSEEEKRAEQKGPAPGSVPDEQLKLRVDFYQSSQSVTVSLFAKDVKKDDLEVKFSRKQVQISPLPRAAAPYVTPGDREATSTFILGGEIDPSNCRWSVTPRKVELVLQKANPGVKWGTWGEEKIGPVSADDEGDVAVAASTTNQPHAQPAQAASIADPKAAAAPSKQSPVVPAYPTSSRSGPKDWDKLGEGDDDDNTGDVNFFFKKLYKGATPEQQRAMMKSFIESNGTALSTDWNDVKSRKVETVPPEGVEAKKWDS